MNRFTRSFWFDCGVLLAVTFLPQSIWAADSARPDIVFVLADDMGYGDPGCYNEQSQCLTPNIDRLAHQGMRFTDAHAAGAVCVPSRYGLLTGRYPFRAQLDWRQRAVIAQETPTVASILRDRGYTTSMVGKWHLGFDGGPEYDYAQPLTGGPVDRGFDRFFGMHASLDIPPYFYIRGRRPTATPTDRIGDNNSPGWSPIQGAFWRGGAIGPDFKHEEVLDRFAAEAVEEVQHLRSQQQPYFLYVALPAPHTPWLPAEQFRGIGSAGMYSEFVAHVDDVVGRIVNPLLEDDNRQTLILFSSDNGPVWYETDQERFGHSSVGSLRGMKGDMWEGGHRVPFIANWSGTIQPGTVCQHLVGFVDLLPTIAELTGDPLNSPIDGVSFAASLRHPQGAAPRSIMLQHHTGQVIREGHWKLIRHLGSGGFSPPRKESAEPQGPQGQLYRLDRDPGETENLWLEEPQRVERMLQLLSDDRN